MLYQRHLPSAWSRTLAESFSSCHTFAILTRRACPSVSSNANQASEKKGFERQENLLFFCATVLF